MAEKIPIATGGEDLQKQISMMHDAMFRHTTDIIDRATLAALREHGKAVREKIVKDNLRQRPGLKVRSGDLRRSFDFVVATNEQSNVLKFFATSKYAPIHEFGGTIRPQGHPYLAIPVGESLTPAGVSKYASPRDVPPFMSAGDTAKDLFAYKSKKGSLFLAREENGKLKIYFLLKDKVTIPARMGLRNTWRDKAPEVIDRVRKHIDIEAQKAK